MTDPEPDETAIIDVDDIRDAAIGLHGLHRADRTYALYYDETNNIRRLYLRDGGFNVPALDAWVLGGVGRRDDRLVDLAPLREQARIQKNAGEVKFHHFAWGDFPTILGSRKLETYLQWVTDDGLLVHYLVLDPFYWSIVDIIDSALTRDAGMLVFAAPQMKSDLYQILRSDLPRTTDLMTRYDYPNVGPDRREAFMTELLQFVRDEQDQLDHFAYQMLRGLLQMGRRKPLPFLEDEAPHVLIDGFKMFFVERICLLKNASHVFDAEDVVSAELAKLTFRSDDAPFCNYRFAVRSHDEPGVQASDVMAGLLGKLFSWIIATPPQEIARLRATLSPSQARNLDRLACLIATTRDENDVLTNAVISLHDQHKAEMFLGIHETEAG